MSRWGARYHAPATLARELEGVWARAWHAVAPASITGVHAVSLGRESVVIQADPLRAWVNVCPHRGMPVCAGPTDQLRCGYHGWTFDTEGASAGGRLRPAEVARRNGLLWVSLDPVEPLDDWIGDLPLPYSQGFADAVQVDLACNWKLSAEVHGEGVHVPTVHPQVPFDASAVQVTRHGRHAHLRLPTPLIGTVDLLWIFPGLQLNLHARGGLAFRHVPHPVDPGRCQFEQWTVGHPARRWSPVRVGPDDPRIGPVTAADLHVAEALQLGTRSSAFDRPRWMPGEEALAWFHQELDRW